jgi:chromate transport protein ChrA
MTISSIISSLRDHTRTRRNASLQPNTEKLGWRLAEVFARTWDLGFTAFGGPPVHFQILHRRFVEGVGFGGGSKWIDEQTVSSKSFCLPEQADVVWQYQEIFAICQALPGPASTKMVFCIAMIHAGIGAALFAFLLWSLPGAIGMYALSLGVQKMPDRLPPIVYALLSGMNASTVGVIALAAVQLADKAITDRVTRILVIFGACAGICYNAIWFFPVLIAVGGIVTAVWDVWLRQKVGKLRAGYAAKRKRARNEGGDAEDTPTAQFAPPAEELQVRRPEAVKQRKVYAGGSTDQILATESNAGPSQFGEHDNVEEITESTPVADTVTHNISTKIGLSLVVGFVISFIVVMVIRGTVNTRGLAFDLFSNMYLAGTIIFGGGPVVIPLLRSYVVDPGWVSPRDFLLGLAIIQAFPGPNFNFSVYLGALVLASTKVPTIFGALLAFVAIFTPGIILAVAVQSFWQAMRTKAWVLSILRGINAAVVGLVFTAVYRLWEIGYLTPESSDGKSLALEPWWVVVAAITYAETAWFNVPPAFAIIFGAVLGLGWYGAVWS